MRKFPIQFHVEFGQFEKTESKVGVDELLVCTIVRFGDKKAGSIAWHSVKNEKKETMDSATVFQAWKALAATLLKRDDLNNSHRELLQNAVNAIPGGVQRLR